MNLLKIIKTVGQISAALLLKISVCEAVVYAHVVLDAQTGRIIQSHNADTPTPPASLTKMMTLYMMFEALHQGKLKLSSQITITPHGARQQPTKLGVKPGTKLTVEEAILALLTRSANDVSASYAEQVAKSEEAFARMMTQKARALGLNNTTFKNSSGLPAKGQLTTARDMVRLSRILFHHFPQHTRYFATKVFNYRGQPINNHNHMLGPLPQDQRIVIDGIKTGFINASGFNLAASAIKGNRRMFAVVMGGPNWRWRDQRMAKLLHASYKALEQGHDQDEELFAPHPKKQPPMQARTIAVSHAVTPTPKKADFSWAVQIGTYRSTSQAQKAAKDSLKQLGTAGQNARIAVTPTGRKQKRVFRARLAGLDRTSAETLCKKLTKKGQTCLAMRNVSPKIATAMNN